MSAIEAEGLLTGNDLRKVSIATNAEASSRSVKFTNLELSDQAREVDPKRTRCGQRTQLPQSLGRKKCS